MGGGFGSKFGPDVQGIVCAKLAKQANAAVKLMLDRKEEHLATGNRPSAYARIKAGVSADGTLTAFDAETWGTGGAGAGAGFPLPYVYTFPNRRRSTQGRVHQRRAAACDACARTSAGVLHHRDADGRARGHGRHGSGGVPHQEPAARRTERHVAHVFSDRAPRRSAWERRHPTGDPTPGPIKRGLGCAANRWGGGGRGTKAHCEILPDGGVIMRSGTQDIGTGTRTLVAMVTAETLGLPLSAIKVEIGDSLYPFSGGSGGSTTAASVTPAIRVTAAKALDALAAKVGAVARRGRGVARRGQGPHPRQGQRLEGDGLEGRLPLLGTEPVSVDGEWEQGLSSSGSSGVQFAEVEVDVETGVTRVKRIVCVQDCGLVLDPLTAESQIIGGIVMGIGFALFEDRILDRNTGQMVNPNMEWYLLAGPSDIPQIDVTVVDQADRGVIGLGEPPCIATAAAICQRRGECDRRPRAQPAADARQGAERAGAREDRRDAVKAFAYVNATTETEALAALDDGAGSRPVRGRFLPIAGGMDVLGLMKDYIASARTPHQCEGRGRHHYRHTGRRRPDRRVGPPHRFRSSMPASAGCTPRSLRAAEEVGTPQIKNVGTVGGNLNQRPRCWYFRNEEFHCLKKGGRSLLRGRWREPVSRDLRRRTLPHRAPVESGRADHCLWRALPHRGPFG